MAHPEPGQPMPPYQPAPTAALKPRKRVLSGALILALLAWLATALGIGLTVASHAWEGGCVVDKPLQDGGFLCIVLGGLLSVGAAVTGFVTLTKPGVRGAYLVTAVTALAMAAVGAMVCLFLLFDVTSLHAIIPPACIPAELPSHTAT